MLGWHVQHVNHEFKRCCEFSCVISLLGVILWIGFKCYGCYYYLLKLLHAMDIGENFSDRIRDLEKRIIAENVTYKLNTENVQNLPQNSLNFNLMSPSITRKKPKPRKYKTQVLM